MNMWQLFRMITFHVYIYTHNIDHNYMMIFDNVCIYIYVYIYVHIYIHIHMHVYTSLCIDIWSLHPWPFIARSWRRWRPKSKRSRGFHALVGTWQGGKRRKRPSRRFEISPGIFQQQYVNDFWGYIYVYIYIYINMWPCAKNRWHEFSTSCW